MGVGSERFNERNRINSERQKHRREVKNQNMKIEEYKKRDLLDKIENTEENLRRVQSNLEEKRKEKSLKNLIKQKDKQDNVRRIERMKEYRKNKIMEKIDMETDRTEGIKMERANLLETRMKQTKKINSERSEMIGSFERMKKNGQIDSKALKKFEKKGFNLGKVVLNKEITDSNIENTPKNEELIKKNIKIYSTSPKKVKDLHSEIDNETIAKPYNNSTKNIYQSAKKIPEKKLTRVSNLDDPMTLNEYNKANCGLSQDSKKIINRRINLESKSYKAMDKKEVSLTPKENYQVRI